MMCIGRICIGPLEMRLIIGSLREAAFVVHCVRILI